MGSASQNYLNTITHLGEAEAQAQAESARQKGLIWQGTLQTLGQLPDAILKYRGLEQERQQRAADLQQQAALRQQQAQELQMRMQAQQGQIDAGKMLDNAYQQFGDDEDAITKQLADNGQGHLIPTVREGFAKTKKAQADAQSAVLEADAKQRAYAASLGNDTQAFLDAGGSVEDAAGLLAHKIAIGASKNLISKDDATGLIQSIDPSNPDQFKATVASMRSAVQKEKPDYTIGNQRFSGATNQPIATGQTRAGVPPNVGSFEDYVTRTYGQNPTSEQVLKARGDYGRADDRVAGQQAADITNLTPAGIDMAALNYRKTGQLPPLGMGDRTTRQKILNRAAELTPTDIQRIEAGGTDVAGNRAAYRADTGSLATLQKQRDAIGAFENTAQKNIDNFLAVAKKVPDTGIPLLNSPVRWIAGAGGSADVAQYNAARQVAVSEIAKIVQNPNLSGNLSDSARKEIEAFNPSNATLGQTIAVMNLLKQDMQNRKTSLDQQLKDTRGRIGGAQPAQTPAATPAAIPGFSYQDYLKSRQP